MTQGRKVFYCRRMRATAPGGATYRVARFRTALPCMGVGEVGGTQGNVCAEPGIKEKIAPGSYRKLKS